MKLITARVCVCARADTDIRTYIIINNLNEPLALSWHENITVTRRYYRGAKILSWRENISILDESHNYRIDMYKPNNISQIY
jgi:hypothetical protein